MNEIIPDHACSQSTQGDPCGETAGSPRKKSPGSVGFPSARSSWGRNRAMQAMLQMTKIDIAKLQQAAAG
jgi:hypothetical protein